jgi:hypothetical protein
VWGVGVRGEGLGLGVEGFEHTGHDKLTTPNLQLEGLKLTDHDNPKP